MEQRYVAFDVETPNAQNRSISAIGVSVIEGGKIVKELYTLIDPQTHFDLFNIALTGITPEMERGQPTFPVLWELLEPILRGSVLVAHNAMFDTGVLCACLAHYGLPMPECRYVCTVKVSQRVWPDLANHKLDTVSDYLGITLDHHEAGSDARAAGLILQAALRETGAADADVLADTIGMRMGRISSMGKTPCSIAKNTIEKRRTPAKRNL